RPIPLSPPVIIATFDCNFFLPAGAASLSGRGSILYSSPGLFACTCSFGAVLSCSFIYTACLFRHLNIRSQDLVFLILLYCRPLKTKSRSYFFYKHNKYQTMKNLILSLLILLHFPLMAVTCNRPMVELDDPPLHDIKLPTGFKISIFAKVDNARSLALGTNGTVFVGNREGKKVTALVDKNGDGIAEKQFVIADGMTTPNGVAFKDGDLYVAEVSKIWKFADIENRLENPGEPALIYDQLPTDKHHGWKYIAFGPDGKLYIPIGAPCNICDNTEKDPRYASITRMNADGTGFEIFAHGIRNSVGFAWHPTSGELWFTENGRDMMGDDIPH